MKLALISVAILFMLCACATFQIDDPSGFAIERQGNIYRAISPEGVQMRVRTEDALLIQSAEFWQEALIHQLLKKGYQPLDHSEQFKVGELTGWIIEWGVPYGEQDYIYLTAFVPYRDKVLIVEAAGEHTLFSLHRESLYKSLKSLQIN
ncbi:MAG: hypothetical protein CMN78_00375 [Spirochaetales bacterium]|nr:hypothetical protein [Spirochaetales bacterium]